MGDEETAAQEQPSWWAADAVDDTSPPATSFEEPVVWPETLDWSPLSFDAGLADEVDLPPLGDLTLPADFALPPNGAGPVDLGAPAPDLDLEPLPIAPDDDTVLHFDALPESIWEDAASPKAAASPSAPAVAVYAAEHDHVAGRWVGGRFHVQHGKTAVLGLAALVGLLLLGVMLSSRNRSDLAANDASQTAAGIIAAQNITTTTGVATTTTLPPPPSSTAPVDSVPPSTDAASVAAPAAAAPGPTTTRPRAASTGSGTATPTQTTAAPAPQPTDTTTTTPPPTDPGTTAPVDTTRPRTPPPTDVTVPPFTLPTTETTAPTTPRRTTPSITRPSIP